MPLHKNTITDGGSAAAYGLHGICCCAFTASTVTGMHTFIVILLGNVTISCPDGFVSKKWNVWMECGGVEWIDGVEWSGYPLRLLL